MFKQTMIHPHHRILLSNKKEWTDTCNNQDEPPENYAEFEHAIPKLYMNAVLKSYIYCMIPFIKHF